MDAPISDLLTEWEKDPLHAYGAPVVHASAVGGIAWILSDLHIGAGLAADVTYDGLENFLADDSFARFLEWAHVQTAGRSGLLIINGDFIDFLRIVHCPDEQDCVEWSRQLARLGIARSPESLHRGIVKKELEFGLKTHDFKSVYKLLRATHGHPQLIAALATWLHRGHRLLVTKGNHDLEWYWGAVRNCLRLVLADAMVAIGREGVVAEALRVHVLPRVTFADSGVLLDSDVYIEHGHQFDRYTQVLGKPVRPGGDELNIPFGSFFNRYVINGVELRYPYADKVKPAANLLALMVREHFFVAMKLLFYHIPFMVRIIPKGYYRYILARALPFAAALVLPIAFLVWFLWPSIWTMLTQGSNSGLLAQTGQGLAMPVVSYFLARLVAYLQLSEPSDLDKPAREVLAKNPGYRLVTFGHTHNPTQLTFENRRFCNTGTWIPVVEISTSDMREDRTYTFLEIRRVKGQPVETACLQRWNDDAGRADLLTVVRAQE